MWGKPSLSSFWFFPTSIITASSLDKGCLPGPAYGCRRSWPSQHQFWILNHVIFYVPPGRACLHAACSVGGHNCFHTLWVDFVYSKDKQLFKGWDKREILTVCLEVNYNVLRFILKNKEYAFAVCVNREHLPVARGNLTISNSSLT